MLVSRSTSANEDAEGENPTPHEETESESPRLNSAKGDNFTREVDGVLYPPEGSLEEHRCGRAASYKSSVLDEYLMKHSTDAQPTPQELIKTQKWGHGDPRIIWPRKQSPEWLAEKQREIAARGGRKANFGKLLTPQVVKERKERGWGIHQNKDVVDDEKSRDAARALQELFGIKDIDDLEPGVRDG